MTLLLTKMPLLLMWRMAMTLLLPTIPLLLWSLLLLPQMQLPLLW